MSQFCGKISFHAETTNPLKWWPWTIFITNFEEHILHKPLKLEYLKLKYSNLDFTWWLKTQTICSLMIYLSIHRMTLEWFIMSVLVGVACHMAPSLHFVKLLCVSSLINGPSVNCTTYVQGTHMCLPVSFLATKNSTTVCSL